MMKGAYGLAFALALGGAALVAACGDDPNALTEDRGGAAPTRGGTGSSSGGGASTSSGGGSSSSGGPTPTDTSAAPNTAGKQYFVQTVHPSLLGTCGGCHTTGPGPAWLSNDAEVSYKMMFQMGYVALDSRILLKGPHQTTQGLSADQSQKFTTWVQMELQAGGANAAPDVLSKLGACFDRTKFDAIKLGDMRTIQRTQDNNANAVTPWNENANNCTGCNNAPCRNCHSGDDATLFVNAVGNPNLSQDYTFENSKKTSPAYITKYFGVSPTGDPIPSNAIKIKADATAKDKAYTHPYFMVDADLQGRIDAFVNDAIAKYKSTAGKCQ